MQKWTQDEAIAFECAREIITDPEKYLAKQERARRKASIDNARGSVRFEGFILPPEIERINQRFIDGELTGDQHMEAIKTVVLHE